MVGKLDLMIYSYEKISKEFDFSLKRTHQNDMIIDDWYSTFNSKYDSDFINSNFDFKSTDSYNARHSMGIWSLDDHAPPPSHWIH